MKETQIIQQLNQLRSITPDPDFANSSKLKIIYQTPQRPGGVFVIIQSLSASLSIGLVIVLFVFVALLGVSNLRSPLSPTFEGVNGGLVAEADSVNATINIHLEEMQYITDIATKTLARGNQDDGNNSSDEEIDDLLNEAINL
jgi:hypothetical protein